ncbi:MAG: NAD-dependent epimerase/dehydratase family protein [Gemmatimonadales bacterium]
MLSVQKARCLVTGGAGFIGSHVAERLACLGHDVRVVDNLSTGDEANLAGLDEKIEFVYGDLCDADVCRSAVAGIDVVFHLAALPSVPRSLEDPWASHDANVNATVRLLEACRAAEVRRIVYASSSSVYGDTAVLPKAESAEPLPRSPYAVSKLAGEQYVLGFARAGLIEGVALRYFNVFGPRQSPHSPYAAVIAAFLLAALNRREATLFGEGVQTRDFTYVDNVVDANLLAASLPAPAVNGWVANVGAGARTSLLELLDLVSTVTRRAITYRRLPARPGDVRDSLASLERVERLLGYRPRTSLIDGLRRTWAWFQASATSTAPRSQEPAGVFAAGDDGGSESWVGTPVQQ